MAGIKLQYRRADVHAAAAAARRVHICRFNADAQRVFAVPAVRACETGRIAMSFDKRVLRETRRANTARVSAGRVCPAAVFRDTRRRVSRRARYSGRPGAVSDVYADVVPADVSALAAERCAVDGRDRGAGVHAVPARGQGVR